MINPFDTPYIYVLVFTTVMFMYFSIMHILRDPNLPKKKFFKSKDTK
jgi:hypothetical protein